MNVSFNKQMKSVEREVLLKSVDLDDDVEDFQFELDNFKYEDEIIAIAPKCVRCNLCVEYCPVEAIEPANIFKIAKITDKCVKCEICVQTCPISAIKLIENSVIFDGEDSIEYNVVSNSRPHRIVRMNDISIDYSRCNTGADCAEFCPTNAITPQFKDYFDDIEGLKEDVLYPALNKDLCIGCGACIRVCDDNVISLDRYVGPSIPTRNLEINQDICVNCYLCEENCPVDAIQLIDGEVVLDDDKCIRCINCTSRCPVGALELVNID